MFARLIIDLRSSFSEAAFALIRFNRNRFGFNDIQLEKRLLLGSASVRSRFRARSFSVHVSADWSVSGQPSASLLARRFVHAQCQLLMVLLQILRIPTERPNVQDALEVIQIIVP